MKKVDLFANGGISVNCKIKNGMLIPAIAPHICADNAPRNITVAKYCADVGRYLVWAEGKTYTSQSGERFLEMFDVAAQYPFIIEQHAVGGDAQGVILGDTLAAVRTREYVTSRQTESKLRCGIMHCGRLFGVDKSDGLMLRWSGEGGALDWTEGISGAGWFYPEGGLGNILDVLPYNGRLLLLRENGLTLFKGAGTPENFAAERHIGVPCITANTGAVAQNGVYFCAKDGLYIWKGGAPERIDDGLFAGMKPEFCFAYGAKYLACGVHSALGRRAVYVYDGADSTSHLCDVAASAICGGGEITLFNGSNVYKLTEGGAPYNFTSGRIDFGTVKQKTLTKLEISSENPVDAIVENGVVSRIFRGVCGIVRPDLRGACFKVTLSGEGKIYSAAVYTENENAI